MKKILLLATGGTIASQDTGKGLSPELDVQGLLSYIPETAKKYQLDAVQILNIESSDLEPAHWLVMVRAIQEHYDDYDGFVVAHGTDTLAYTSAALTYLIQNSTKTIVVTGSQYPIDYPSTDAIRNLSDSIRFAADSGMPGIYVVFSGKAILGNHAKKMRTKNYDAFDSVNYPEAAVIRDHRIVRYQNPTCCKGERKDPPKFYTQINENVFLLKFYPGIRPEAYQFVEQQYRAVVMEAYGVAGLPASFLPLFQQWHDKGILMVVTTQVMYEGSDLEVYTVGNALSRQYQVLQGYDMTSEAILAKLMYILGKTSDQKVIRQEFLTSVQWDLEG